jgi:hypothetical protein
MQEEKQQANDDVRTACSVLDLESNPDRAAQLVETASTKQPSPDSCSNWGSTCSPRRATSATQVQNTVSGAATADPAGGEGARLQNRIVRQVFGMIGSKHFPEAREMAWKLDDPGIGSQVRTLVDFGETAAALDGKDAQLAFTLSNPIRGGVKRGLLYAGMTAAACGRHTVSLNVPGLETATLTGAIAKFSLVDVQRLEGFLAGIRDENLMSSQLAILAALRLKN